MLTVQLVVDIYGTGSTRSSAHEHTDISKLLILQIANPIDGMSVHMVEKLCNRNAGCHLTSDAVKKAKQEILFYYTFQDSYFRLTLDLDP